MKKWGLLLIVLFLATAMVPGGYAQAPKFKILVVDSYGGDYAWSRETGEGLCAALKDFKFLDNDQQIKDYVKNDLVETDTAVIKKLWMDTKHKNKKDEITAAAASVMSELKTFKPDLVFLGDDNAANYVGAQLIDAGIPVVFWGVDLHPMRYGYLDTMEHPGHNITGIYQAGYYREGLEYLKKLFPDIRSFAILSDDSETGRAKSNALSKLAGNGQLPLQLVDEIATNSFSEWKIKALELQGKVDAFFVVNHSTLKDDEGNPVDSMKVGAWYLSNIKKPEAVPEKQFVQEGMLLAVDDSGFKQGYEAGRMADMILHGKIDPAAIAVIAPARGAVLVNKLRAKELGIDLTGKDFIEESVDGSKALEKYPQ